MKRTFKVNKEYTLPEYDYEAMYEVVNAIKTMFPEIENVDTTDKDGGVFEFEGSEFIWTFDNYHQTVEFINNN